MKSIILWIYPLLIILSSCETPPKAAVDHNLVIDPSITSKIESELAQLNYEIIFLKDHFEFLLANRDSLLQYAELDKYTFDGPYSINTPKDSEKLSSLMIMNTTPDFDKAMENVWITNGMDSLFNQLFTKSDLISQVYFNTVDQVSRVFPAYDSKTLVDPGIDVTSFNFFYKADMEHNPERGPVWISEVYIDPAGRGWILSLVHPVFDQGKLYAVLGIDITVDELINRYLDRQEDNFMIVNNKGDIVGGNAKSIEALSFPPLLNHVYRETILEDNFRIADYNLFNSKNNEVRKMAKSILLEKKNHFFFQDEFSPEAAYAIPFSLLDWYLIDIEIRSK